MAITASDAFTGTAGTDLDGRAADAGGTWDAQPSAGGSSIVISDANRARANTAGSLHMYILPVAALVANEYDVLVDVVALSLLGSYNEIGVMGRFHASNNTGYFAVLSNTGTAYLYLVNNGSYTELDSAAYTFSNGTHSIRLEIRDATKKLFVNSSEILSSTDNTITAIGNPGLFFYTDGAAPASGTGPHFDNFQVDDLTGGGGEVESEVDFAEEETLSVEALVVVSSVAAFTEQETLPAPADTYIYVNVPAAFEEQELFEGTAVSDTEDPVDFEEDETLEAGAVVRVFSDAVFSEDETFATGDAGVSVFGDAAFTENETLGVVDGANVFATAAFTENESLDVDATIGGVTPVESDAAFSENETLAVTASLRRFSVAAFVENEIFATVEEEPPADEVRLSAEALPVIRLNAKARPALRLNV